MIPIKIKQSDAKLNRIINRRRLEEFRIKAKNSDDFSSYGPFDFTKVEHDDSKKASIADLKIQLAALETQLEEVSFLKFSEVLIDETSQDRMMGYGGFNHALIIEHENGLVTDLWIYHIEFFEPKNLIEALTVFGDQWKLLLFDKDDILIDLDDEEMLRGYVKKLK
jgi:hypothetical protein